MEAAQEEAQFIADSSTEFSDCENALNFQVMMMVTMMKSQVADTAPAPAIFNQIDVLSLPGAGLRHLDFPNVGSLFQGFYTGDDSSSQLQMETVPPSMSTRSCFVRTYGSESEM